MKVYVDKSQVVDRTLLEKDKLPYAVLFQVLGGTVKKVITDHKRIIIAHTAAVFPTWIWAPDDVSDEELDMIYRTIRSEFSPIQEYRFNTKYEIASYLVQRFREEKLGEWDISANIAVYECRKPKAPAKQVDGHLEVISEADIELASRMIREASLAIGDRVFSEEESVQAAKKQLERQCLYVWRDKDGTPVSFCDRSADENYVKVGQVYTVSEARGKNYAGRMIYEICEDIVKTGQIPMLYANADYVPSNRCYQNIGFELKGKIATISCGAAEN